MSPRITRSRADRHNEYISLSLPSPCARACLAREKKKFDKCTRNGEEGHGRENKRGKKKRERKPRVCVDEGFSVAEPRITEEIFIYIYTVNGRLLGWAYTGDFLVDIPFNRVF